MIESASDIFVYSRGAIERVPAHDVPHVIVSITTTPDDMAQIPASPWCRGLLRLSFLDADQGAGTLFSKHHATQIWNLVLHTPDVGRVVLHCDAGYSRSPAVGAAIAKVFTGDDMQFFRQYRPNMLVYRTMLDTFVDDYAATFPSLFP